jgi:AcrR family transcriptional regulator
MNADTPPRPGSNPRPPHPGREDSSGARAGLAGGHDAEAAPLRRDAQRNRERILSAAREVFADEGLETSLEHIARRAGVGIGTLYRRFPDREMLVDALFEDQLQQLVALGQDAVRDEDAWRGLVQFLERMLSMQVADRGLKDLVTNRTHGRERIQLLRDRLGPLVDRLCTRAQQQGSLRADVSAEDMPVIAAMIGSAIDMTAVAPNAWKRYLHLVLDGLASRRAAPGTLPAPALSNEQLDKAMRQHKGRGACSP